MTDGPEGGGRSSGGPTPDGDGDGGRDGNGHGNGSGPPADDPGSAGEDRDRTGAVRSALARVGLDGREAASWAFYDWANSAFATVALATVLPIYYVDVAGATLPGNLASVYWGYTLTASFALVAVASPVLGAAADHIGAKKRLLAAFQTLGVVGTALLFLAGRGDWAVASGAFVLANVGFAGSNLFYNSLLPHVADEGEMDSLSAAGFALGYLGGGLLLVGALAVTVRPGLVGLSDGTTATRYVFVAIAVWWTVFSVPLFRNVEEPPPSAGDGGVGAGGEDDGAGRGSDPSGGVLPLVRASFGRLRRTFREVRRFRHAALFLGAFWLYGDAINAMTTLAAAYAVEIGLGREAVLGALVLVQFVGVPSTFLYGPLVERFSAKTGLYFGLVVYTGLAVGGYFVTSEAQFLALALVVGTVQGGTQALSRSVFGSMVPAERSSEFFSFFNVSSKFASVLGPLLFSAVGQLTGSARASIVSLVVLFLAGLALLTRVDLEAGRRAAREASDRGRTGGRTPVGVGSE